VAEVVRIFKGGMSWVLRKEFKEREDSYGGRALGGWVICREGRKSR